MQLRFYHKRRLLLAVCLIISIQLLCFYFLDTPNAKFLANKRAKAAVVILTRSQDLASLRETLAEFEFIFNHKFNYPYVFLNEQPFSDEFKMGIMDLLTNGYRLHRNIEFGLIPTDHWSYPEWIDQTAAANTRRKMEDARIIYGGSESYRHMCRYFAGFFHRHPLLAQYDYYWRVEPGAKFFCQLDYDPFVFMMENGVEYGFTQVMPEYMATVPTLWNTTKLFMQDVLPSLNIEKPASPVLRFFLDDESRKKESFYRHALKLQSAIFESADNFEWSGCHFWSNFEIGSLNFFRSPLYQRYFDFLDHAGGFFYERWGDAPVHSLAVGMFLETWQIHHFADIGYLHEPFSWCPPRDAKFPDKCFCDYDRKYNLAKDGPHTCISNFLANLKAARHD